MTRRYLRLAWAGGFSLLAILLLDLGVVDGTSRWAVTLYKLSQATIAWIVWHLLRSQTFYYLDLETELRNGGVAAAIIVAGTCIAFLLGFLLGL